MECCTDRGGLTREPAASASASRWAKVGIGKAPACCETACLCRTLHTCAARAAAACCHMSFHQRRCRRRCRCTGRTNPDRTLVLHAQHQSFRHASSLATGNFPLAPYQQLSLWYHCASNHTKQLTAVLLGPQAWRTGGEAGAALGGAARGGGLAVAALVADGARRPAGAELLAPAAAHAAHEVACRSTNMSSCAVAHCSNAAAKQAGSRGRCSKHTHTSGA